jgi:phosphoglycerate dehydrogenase-like enzyme
MPKIIAVRGQQNQSTQERIAAAAGGAEVRFVADAAELADLLPHVAAVGGEVSEAELALAPKLEWVHSWAAGPRVFPALIDHPAVMTSSKGNGAIPLAEQALLLMIMLNRDALRWLTAQREHRWDRFTHGELAGHTAVLVGLGNSGIHLAGALTALGVRVIGVRRNTALPSPGVDRVVGPEQLLEVLPEADFVVVTAPYTTDTADLLGEEHFRAMKPSSYYICVSRGGIADDVALEKALRDGWIAGAGLDAHTIEPLPAESPFWDLPNTIVTPHNGATTAETAVRGVDIFVENLARFVRGEALTNLVDKSAGY